MLFIAVFFLVFALFVVARVFRGFQAIWLGLILFTFGCCILGLVGLVPRFGNYRLNGWFSLPLDQPEWAWRLLERLSLYDFMRFRLWSAAGFVLAGLVFALSYARERWRLTDGLALLGACGVTGALVWNYDPEHLFQLYKSGARFINHSAASHHWEQVLVLTDNMFLILIVAVFSYSLVRLGHVFVKSSITQKKVQAICVGIGCAVLNVFFILLFCVGRVSVLNAHTMATTLLPLGPNYPVFDATYLRAVPLAAFTAMGAVLIAILRYGFLGSWRMDLRNLDQQINIANQAVRLALHSFKNRFLAVQMAMDMASGQMETLSGEEIEKARTQIKWAKDVCVEALSRLDVLHAQAKRLEVNPKRILLRQLWENAVACYGARMAGVAVCPKYPSGDIYTWGDQDHLESVLENILQNALDAMAEKQEDGYTPQITVEINQEYEWSYIRLTDNGKGIAKENLHKVFRPFYTTKPTKNNWGMGLTYCHRVVKTHGGYINLHSRAGIGTTVEIVLRSVQKI